MFFRRRPKPSPKTLVLSGIHFPDFKSLDDTNGLLVWRRGHKLSLDQLRILRHAGLNLESTTDEFGSPFIVHEDYEKLINQFLELHPDTPATRRTVFSSIYGEELARLVVSLSDSDLLVIRMMWEGGRPRRPPPSPPPPSRIWA